MQIKETNYKYIILALLFMAGVSIAGSAFAYHYDIAAKSAESQKDLKDDIKTTNAMPSDIEHIKLISLLVCAGLIGFFGVRRQRNTLKRYVRDKRSEIKLRVNLLSEKKLKQQACPLWKRGCVAS